MGPPSGALLDLGVFSVQPTLEAGDFGPVFMQTGTNTLARGLHFMSDFSGGLYVPPGTGVCFVSVGTDGGNPSFEVSLTWTEDF